MNSERIDQIAFDAGCHRHKYSDPEHPDLEGFIINHEGLDKFAELIIRECARVIDRGNGEVCSTSEHMWCNICRDDILKHFGLTSSR